MKPPRPLPGRAGGAAWLLAHELRLAFRRGRSARPRSGLWLIGLLGAGWLVLSYILISPLARNLPPPPLGHDRTDALALLLITIMLSFVATLMISQAVQRAIEALYERADLDLLLSSPVSGWTIMVVRAAGIALSLLPLYAGLLLPPLLWLTVFNSPFWLTAIPSLVALALIAAGAGLALVAVLFRLIGARATRIVAQVASLLIGAAIFLAFQLPNLSQRYRGEGEPEAAWIRQFETLEVDAHALWLAPARAFTGDPAAALGLAALAALVFPLAVRVFSARFISDAAAAAGGGGGARRRTVRTAGLRTAFTQAMLRKELRLIARDPVLISRVGLQIIYLAPLAFILVTPDDAGEAFQPAALAPVLTLLASSLAGSLAWITVSAEDAPDLLASAPVSRARLERAKVAAAMLPVAAIMAVPLLALAWQAPIAGLWGIAGCLTAMGAAAAIQVWRQTPASRRDFMRRRARGAMSAQWGQSFVAMFLAGAVAFGAYGLPWLALLPGILAAAVFGAMHRRPEEADAEARA
jgi:ABC-2 type transport system permease protein